MDVLKDHNDPLFACYAPEDIVYHAADDNGIPLGHQSHVCVVVKALAAQESGENAGKDGPGIYIRKIIFDLGHPAYPCHYAVPGRVRIAFAYGAGS